MITSGSWRRKARSAVAKSSRRGVNGHLHDALDLVFDRILDGNDLEFGAIDRLQPAVERGGLSRTGRARNEKNPVRPLYRLLHATLHFGRQAEISQVQVHRRAIQHAQDHALTELRGHGRDTEIDRPTGDWDTNASILWKSAFGNVQVGKDLDP